MIGVIIDELKFPTPRVIIGLRLDGADRIGDDRRRLEVIGEIIRNRVAWKIFAGHALAVEEDVFALEIT